MTTEKPSMEWLNEMIKDEEKGKAEYDKYGFFNLARDEQRHREVLQKFLHDNYSQGGIGGKLKLFGRKLL
jgi:hypothetical protein